MKPTVAAYRSYPFYIPNLDTHLLVEDTADGVVIRASRNTFNEARQSAFVRHLAAEGFIADSHAWHTPSTFGPHMGVTWVMDYSWLELDAATLAVARRAMVRLFAGSILVWFLLMGWVLLTH